MYFDFSVLFVLFLVVVLFYAVSSIAMEVSVTVVG